MTLASSPLVTALITLMQAGVPAARKVYLAQAATGAEPAYAVVYPNSGMKSAFHRDLLNAGPTDLLYQVTCVGSTPEQAAWMADKMTAALLGSVPTVSGRRVWPAIQQGSQPVRRDDESEVLFIATSQWLTRSDPA
ncbi:hypothetical protein HS041_12320 [Planomonospora sp. ID67723]|uniref:hypothetical protein n=1 Tax=Planomonospora sp. ID67723 TaxID=2738134 RepID=UPI0018C3F222|nr:hypothetical protein [Planomonospora sp. ID67723]MBG0828554.1 hypothetical protein [Planomonospora sp. ID67723]